MAFADELQAAHDLREREPKLAAAIALAEEVHAPQKTRRRVFPTSFIRFV